MTSDRLHHGRRGFTLFELILSSGIIAMLMLTLYTALHTGFKARLSLNTAASKVRSARIALDLVEQNLRSVLPPSGAIAGPFVGTASEIDCYALGRDYGRDNDALSDGMRSISMLIASDAAVGDADAASGATLVQKVTRNLLPASPVEPTTEIIAAHVTAFTARYYDGDTWADAWDSTQLSDTLPVAVEVTVSVQPIATEPPFTLRRVIVMPCGTNINNQTAEASSAEDS